MYKYAHEPQGHRELTNPDVVVPTPVVHLYKILESECNVWLKTAAAGGWGRRVGPGWGTGHLWDRWKYLPSFLWWRTHRCINLPKFTQMRAHVGAFCHMYVICTSIQFTLERDESLLERG